MIAVIAGNELRRLFFSPLAWSLMAVTQLLLAWLFLVQIEAFLELQPRLATLENPPGVTELVAMPLLDSAAVILMLLVPLLSMGLFSREFLQGTYSLLIASPVSVTGIVVGKYLALLATLAVILLLVALMPLSLLLGGALDLGTLSAGLLGLALTLAAYGAVGLLLSSLTRQPAIAAIGSYGLLLLLWIINLAGTGKGSTLFEQLAISSHFHRLLSGLVVSTDLIYFVLLILCCLILTIRRLDSLRSRG
jgi:ABC-2 type transport system permease protein